MDISLNINGSDQTITTSATAPLLKALREAGYFSVRFGSHDGQTGAAAVSHYGRIDILVNNAGVFTAHPLADVSYETWQAAWQTTINTNLIGVANLCYCVGQQMIQQGYGRIVNVSSRGAFRGEPLAPAYGASKAGLNAMSQSLAQYLAPHVGVVAPGFVETDMAQEILESPKERQFATKVRSNGSPHLPKSPTPSSSSPPKALNG